MCKQHHLRSSTLIFRVAVITGGGSGIGKATALLFARNNFKVAIADLIEAHGALVVLEIEKNGGEAIFVKADVSVESEVQNLIDVVVAKYGRLDAAVNSAGITGELNGFPPLHETKTEVFNKVYQVNTLGTFLSMKYQIKQFLKQKEGRKEGEDLGTIVNLSSMAGLREYPGGVSYCASKHAIVGISKTAAKEYLSEKIRVNALCPGFIDTPFVDSVVKEIEQKIQAPFTIDDLSTSIGKPEEVAEAILWLSSPSSSYVNGITLTIDGASNVKRRS